MEPPASPRIAAFSKYFMDELCVSHTLSLEQWIAMTATLGVDGLKLYPGFFASFDSAYVETIHTALKQQHLLMPMLCASPDFTQPNPALRQAEVERYKQMMDLVAFFDARHLVYVVSSLVSAALKFLRTKELRCSWNASSKCFPMQPSEGFLLTLENHYKDNYWTYPEFARQLHAFLRIINAIDSSSFGSTMIHRMQFRQVKIHWLRLMQSRGVL